MFHLNEKFKGKLSPAKWRNRVSAFLNNLIGDNIIEVVKPDEPNSGNPPTVRLIIHRLVQRLRTEGFGSASTNTYEEGANATETLKNAQKVAEGHPKPDKYVNQEVDTDNTAQQIANNEIALIGVSNFYAREDHRHRLATEQGTPEFRGSESAETSTMINDTSESDYPEGAEFALNDDEWNLNDTDGFNLLTISRIAYEPIEGIHILFFREVKVAKNGNIIKVGAEIGATRILA